MVIMMLKITKLIADAFQAQLDDYCRLNENYPPPSVASKPRAILLITDRTMDLYSPLYMNFLIKLWPWILLKVWKEPGNININQRMKRGNYGS